MKGGKSLDIRPLHLSEGEVSDLVAFLHALSSPASVPRLRTDGGR